MLKLNVRNLIDAKVARDNTRVNFAKISDEIKLSEKTVRAAYYGTTSFTGQRLEQWCKYLHCQPGDILEYIPAAKDAQS